MFGSLLISFGNQKMASIRRRRSTKVTIYKKYSGPLQKWNGAFSHEDKPDGITARIFSLISRIS
jgi:hypothetical protein